MKKIYSIFIFILSFSLHFNAQPPSKFFCTYGGNGYDYGYDVKQTLDNGYIITGSTSSFGQGNTDVYLLKLDSMGQKKFEKTFGSYSNDIGKSVVQLADSSYVISGYSSSFGIGGYDIYIFKTDKNGVLIWEKTIGGNDWDFGYSLQATTDGGFIIAGTTYSYGYGNADGYIVKIDANGIIQWSKTYGGKKDDEFKSVIQTQDGGYAFAGYTKSYNDTVNGDAWVVKIDLNGDSATSFSYNFGLNDGFNDIKELLNGDFLTAGFTTFNTNLKRQAVFNKISPSGQILLHTTEGQVGTDEEFFKVDTSNSSFGTYIVLGNSHENNTSYKTDIKLLLLNSGGGYVNGGAVGSFKDDECFSFCLTKDLSKGYAAIGYTNSYNSILTDCFLMKYDSLLSIGNSIIGVKEIDQLNQTVKIYPNPVETMLFFRQNTQLIQSYNIEIHTYLGTKIYSTIIKEKEFAIDLEHLDDGIYIVTIFDNKQNSITKKIVKRTN